MTKRGANPGALARWWPAIAQIALAIGGLGWLLLAPPAYGAIMLVPLTPAAAAGLPALALQGEARLIAAGPLPGSLIVEGARGRLAPAALAHAVLPLASPPAGCLAPRPEARA